MNNHQQLKQSLAMGALCALVGLLTAVLIVITATGSGYEWFVLAAPSGAFVTAAVLWWLFVARKRSYGTVRGAVTGAIAGAVGHYLCWVFMLWGSAGCHALTGGCTSSLGEAPMNPFEAIPAAALFSAFSLLFFGWLTIPAGALLGGLLARMQGKTKSQP